MFVGTEVLAEAREVVCLVNFHSAYTTVVVTEHIDHERFSAPTIYIPILTVLVKYSVCQKSKHMRATVFGEEYRAKCEQISHADSFASGKGETACSTLMP